MAVRRDKNQFHVQDGRFKGSEKSADRYLWKQVGAEECEKRLKGKNEVGAGIPSRHLAGWLPLLHQA